MQYWVVIINSNLSNSKQVRSGNYRHNGSGGQSERAHTLKSHFLYWWFMSLVCIVGQIISTELNWTQNLTKVP